jgi:hypothetical protein
MGYSGIPVRLGLSATAITQILSVSINLYYPGTNNLYTMLATDYLVIDSLMVATTANTSGVALLSAAAGATAITSANLLAAFLGITSSGLTFAPNEGLCGLQGVLPSVIAVLATTATVYISGTGHIVNGPGAVRPSFQAPLTGQNTGI